MKNNHSEKPKQDMGTGSVGKLLAQLAIPAVVAQVVNLLYNIVDRIYIGHMPEVGANALTGVGLFMPILMLVNAFAMMAGAGGAPRAAIAMGQGNHDRAEKIVGANLARYTTMSSRCSSRPIRFWPVSPFIRAASS